MLRILIVDDRPEVRFGLRLRLGAEPDMIVAGEAGDGCGALALAGRLAPDVILMDVVMPPPDGIEVARALHQLHPDIPVVFLTMRDSEATRARAAAAHAPRPRTRPASSANRQRLNACCSRCAPARGAAPA